jgi:hypothetical protein
MNNMGMDLRYQKAVGRARGVIDTSSLSTLTAVSDRAGYADKRLQRCVSPVTAIHRLGFSYETITASWIAGSEGRAGG